MEDALLNRNRRNFVAIAVALLLVNLFGWDFPDSITLFGNQFNSSGATIHVLAGVLFVYWGWEYWHCFRSQIDWWRTEWRKKLLHQIRCRKDILGQVDPESLSRRLENNKGYELARAEMNWHVLTRDGILIMTGNAVIENATNEPTSSSGFKQGYKIQYKKLRWDRFISTMKFLFNNPTALNLWIPLFLGAAVVVTEFLRLCGVVILGDPSAQNLPSNPVN